MDSIQPDYDHENKHLLGNGEKKHWRDSNIFNIVLLGIAFMVVFTAFSPTQNLETTLNANLGYLSLSLLYACLSLSNFISPLIVLKLGEKWALIAGTLTYIIYIAANIHVTPVTLCLASALLGFGGAVLWTAEGSFVIRCSTPKTLGLHTGLFFALFQANQIIGNLGTGELINNGVKLETLFIVLSAVGAGSILLFLGLGNPNNLDESEIEKKKNEQIPLSERLMLTLNILKERPVQLLVIALFYSGLSQSFFFGVFPPLSGKYYLSYVMTVFGVCDAVGSVLIGKLSDLVGRKPLVIFSTLCCIGGSVFAYIITYYIHSEHKVVYYFICAGLLGLSDAGYNTQLYALLGQIYPTRGETAAAVFKFIQSTATAIAFFYGKYATLFDQVVIINSFVVPSCILFIIVEMKYKNKGEEFLIQ